MNWPHPDIIPCSVLGCDRAHVATAEALKMVDGCGSNCSQCGLRTITRQNLKDSERLYYQEELEELRALFNLQQKRMRKATELWQRETGQIHVFPDLGDLLEWLMLKARPNSKPKPRYVEKGPRVKAIYTVLRRVHAGNNEWLSTGEIGHEIGLLGHHPQSISTWISKARTWTEATIPGWTISPARDEWKDGKRIAYYRLESKKA